MNKGFLIFYTSRVPWIYEFFDDTKEDVLKNANLKKKPNKSSSYDWCNIQSLLKPFCKENDFVSTYSYIVSYCA